MDQREEHILKQLNKYQFLKRTLQFVFSVSVFSFFVWYSSGFSIHPQSFNAYFSSCLFSMFTHTLERKYMFLICNGILAFLAKNSHSHKTSSPSISVSDIEFQPSNLSETKVPFADMVVVPLGSSESSENVPLEVDQAVIDEQVEIQEYYEQVSKTEEQKNCNDEAYIAEEEEVKGNEEENTEGETECEGMVTEYDELEDTTMTTKEEVPNTDELNRKFEEFIRKMKEEIRIEAQRQLIAV